MDPYETKVLETIRRLDAEDTEPHPRLFPEQVAEAMDPPEDDLERLVEAIKALLDAGDLEPAQPPPCFRLSY